MKATVSCGPSAGGNATRTWVTRPRRMSLPYCCNRSEVEQAGGRCVAHAEAIEWVFVLGWFETLSFRNQPDCLDAWRKKIVTAASNYEARQVDDRCSPLGLQEGIANATFIRTGQWAPPEASLAEKFTAVDPVSLNDLKLQVDARIGCNEQQPTLLAITLNLVWQQRPAITDRATEDAVPPDLIASTDVTRIGAANVRPERTFLADRIVGCVAKVIERGFGLVIDARFHVRRSNQRRTVGPAAYKLRSESSLRYRILRAPLLEIRPETLHILFELAEDQECRSEP